MIAFTILGLLVFWWLCFEFGHFLAWVADADGIVMAVARVLVGSERLEKSLTAFIATLQPKKTP